MSRGTAYYDLPNGERIELPTTMPDVEEVPGPLCDGKFELPEAVKDMFIDLVAEPQHWRFIEHITPDTAEEIRKWKRLAEQAGKDSSWEKAGQGCQHSTGRASRMQ